MELFTFMFLSKPPSPSISSKVLLKLDPLFFLVRYKTHFSPLVISVNQRCVEEGGIIFKCTTHSTRTRLAEPSPTPPPRGHNTEKRAPHPRLPLLPPRPHTHHHFFTPTVTLFLSIQPSCVW
ncbi:unnamed protein product [Boreogadus saida]